MTQVVQLFNIFKPTHYNLSLSIDHTAKTFTGTLTIEGNLTEELECIPLHAKDLIITSAVINGKEAVVSHHDNDELRLSQEGLTAGDHISVITYTGTATDAMHGMYPAYFEHDGVKKHLIATQFESHHAREVFPCVDEPSAKATFDVTLTTETDLTVLGNMPVKTQSIQNDQLVTAFETTPRMSTYLLAWVVGEMHSKTATTSGGVEVNVWATPAQKPDSLDFALDIATRTIDFYDEYFDTPYPLPKSDHVALPDFSSGAMENWGLVTYREIALLADPETSSISNKQYIATVIAHELAHQWFGNLVTMKWWNNLWLNESFATLMEYVAVDALHPEWSIWLDFASNKSIMALRRDAIDGVQSVQMDVNHPDEISTLFDGAIVYAKGARLLHMLRTYIGDTAFQAGLKTYFDRHAYGNTEGDDLWDALAESSGKDITAMMNTWISQPGYPILSVSSDDQQRITLTQEQFFIGDHELSDRLWPIPLNSSCSEMPTIFDEKTATIQRHHETPLQFNTGSASHFITHYSPDLLQRLLTKVQDGTMSEIDRLSLLNEVTLLARAGRITSAELLPILSSYKNETSEPVWGLISITLAELRKFVEKDEDAEKALKNLSATVALKQYEELGWEQQENEPAEVQKLRGTIISLMLYGENPEALAHARTLYKETPLTSLNPELRSVILSSVVRHGDESIVTNLIEQYGNTQDAELAQDICLGLTSTKSPEAINTLLSNMKDSSVVRPQDVARWFAYLIRNRYAREQAWQWLTENWNWIEKSFGGDKSYDYFPQYAASGLLTKEQLDDYVSFFTPMLDDPSLKRVVTLGITEIKARVALIEKDTPAVLAALRSS